MQNSENVKVDVTCDLAISICSIHNGLDYPTATFSTMYILLGNGNNLNVLQTKDNDNVAYMNLVIPFKCKEKNS